MIVTGLETKEDFDDFIDECREVVKIKKELGVNTPLRWNGTPLVLYNASPLRWYERVTAKNSWNNVRNMGYVIDAMKELGIRSKFNGRGGGTAIEQFILDIGQAGTKWLVDATLKYGLMYEGMYSENDREAVRKALLDNGLAIENTWRARDLEEVFPDEHIQVVPDAKMRHWKEMFIKQDFSSVSCIATPLNPKGNCRAKDCGHCVTAEQIKGCSGRTISNTKTVEEIITDLGQHRAQATTRIVLNQNPAWEMVSREALKHYITSLIIRDEDGLLNNFHSVDKTSCTWSDRKALTPWFSGQWAFEIKWKNRVPLSLIEEGIKKANSALTTCKIVNVFNNTEELKIAVGDRLQYVAYTDRYTLSAIKDKIANFDWMVKVITPAKGQGLMTEKIDAHQLKDRVLAIGHGDKVVLHLDLETKFDPYLFLSSLVNKSYDRVRNDFRASLVGHGKPNGLRCSCGGDILHSMFTDKQEVKCPKCIGKFRLMKITGKA